MALTATIHTFEISLSDVDRGCYESLALRVARHPSESEEYLVTRVLAYCLEYTEGIAFSKGLAEPDEPALSVRDMTGTIKSWIEIGVPDASRLHKAGKVSPRVAVYTHKDPSLLVRHLTGERIHRGDELELYAVDRSLVTALVERLERRMVFDLSVSDRHLYLAFGEEQLSGVITPFRLGEP
jgi:uncharacterized protein YaeQ